MLEPQAVQITKETYPIAIACLPGVFATIPFKKVKGCYLVINLLQDGHVKGWGTKPFLNNVWYSEELFHHKYRFLAKPIEGRLTPIELR